MAANRGSYHYTDALLRYYFKIDPDQLSDEDWALQVKLLENIRNDELKNSQWRPPMNI